MNDDYSEADYQAYYDEGDEELMDKHNDFIMRNLISVAETWPKEHLDNYIKNLEDQINDIHALLKELKIIQRRKQKERDRKLRETGPRGAA